MTISMRPPAVIAATAPAPSRLGRFLTAWPPGVILAIAWIVAMLFVAIFADQLSPQGFTKMDLRARLADPWGFGGTTAHLLGTDELGRDVLSRLLHSIRMSLLVAFLGTLLSAFIGISVGFLAAHFRGWIEEAMMALADMQASLPFMIIALAVLAFFGNSLVLFIALMGLNNWERFARISRGLAIAASEQGYAGAVRHLGGSPWRVYGLHILPNIAGTLLVSMTLSFPEIILLESGLSFLGLGVQPPLTSLGNMVGYGREYMQSAPWIMLAPSVIIVLTTLAISILGDWLRDRLDPTLR